MNDFSLCQDSDIFPLFFSNLIQKLALAHQSLARVCKQSKGIWAQFLTNFQECWGRMVAVGKAEAGLECFLLVTGKRNLVSYKPVRREALPPSPCSHVSGPASWERGKHFGNWTPKFGSLRLG
jgi:hypothetical protein